MRPVCRECAYRLRILRAAGLLCMSCPSPERGYAPPFCRFLPVPAGDRRCSIFLLLVRMIFAFATYGLRLFCCATRAAKKGAAGKTSSVFLFCKVGVSFCVLSVVAWADMQAGSGGPNGGSGYPRISCVRIRVLIYRALTSIYPAFATHGIAFRRPYDRTASLCFLSPHLPAGACLFCACGRHRFFAVHPRPFTLRPTFSAAPDASRVRRRNGRGAGRGMDRL